MSEAGVFTVALKDLELVVLPGEWQRLEIDVGAWLPDGYAILEAQLYADPWADFEAPSDIRTRLQREAPDGTLDFTAETTHAIADDFALARCTMMHVRADTPVALTVRVRQAPLTLHTVIYRGVSLAAYGAGDPGARDAEWIAALTSGSAWPVYGEH